MLSANKGLLRRLQGSLGRWTSRVWGRRGGWALHRSHRNRALHRLGPIRWYRRWRGPWSCFDRCGDRTLGVRGQKCRLGVCDRRASHRRWVRLCDLGHCRRLLLGNRRELGRGRRRRSHLGHRGYGWYGWRHGGRLLGSWRRDGLGRRNRRSRGHLDSGQRLRHRRSLLIRRCRSDGWLGRNRGLWRGFRGWGRRWRGWLVDRTGRSRRCRVRRRQQALDTQRSAHCQRWLLRRAAPDIIARRIGDGDIASLTTPPVAKTGSSDC